MQGAECMKAEDAGCIVRICTASKKACLKTEGTRRSAEIKSWPQSSLVAKLSVIPYQCLTHSFADSCHLAEWDFLKMYLPYLCVSDQKGDIIP